MRNYPHSTGTRPPDETNDTPSPHPVRYRFLCLSRNLTFDRSWDTILMLDGTLQDRAYGYPVNHPLGDFIATLPNLAVRPVHETTRKSVNLLQNEVCRVAWQVPENFDEKSLEFCPLGLTRRRRWPFNEAKYRLLVVSPFLTPGFLRDITKGCENNTLVTRLDEVEKLSRYQLSDFQKIYILSPEADTDLQDDLDEADQSMPNNPGFDTLLSGLHAKLYIFHNSWDAHIWTGSANATHAAMNDNVEFLVKLKGKKSKVGIDKFLDFDKKPVSFAGLLQEYTPPDKPAAKDEVQERLDELVIQAQRTLAQTKLKAVVTTTDKTDGGNDTYQITLSTTDEETFPNLSDVVIHCWPITRQQEDAVLLNPASKPLAQFDSLSFAALTSFFAFEIKAGEGNKSATSRFVLNIPLENAPADRQERLLRHLLQSKRQVMRYLLFLLAEGGDSYEIIAALTKGTADGSSSDDGLGLPTNLFEALVCTLERNPARLDQIDRLVKDLEQTDDGLSLLPDDFMTIWQPIWQARQRLAGKQKGKQSRGAAKADKPA